MRTIFLITLIAAISISCKRSYKTENGIVYYEYWNEGSGQNKVAIEKADAKTFETTEFDCDCSFAFARDKNHLYIDGKIIKSIDPDSFKFLGNYFFRDKDSVYFFGFYSDIQDCSIRGINPEKLHLLKYPWAKSENILIHGNATLSLGDIERFSIIDENWGKTDKYVIYGNEILKNADPKTFHVINSYSGKDKNHIYEFGKIKK